MSITKQIILDHLSAEFNSALPVWIDKESMVFKSISISIIEQLSEVLTEHFENSDFFNSIKAKLFKQNDYLLLEHQENIEAQFKRKYRTIFRRGTYSLDQELSRLFKSIDDILYYETYLYYDKLFLKQSTFELGDSRTLLSGWIADQTFPSINQVELGELAQDSCEFMFSEKDFISLIATNNTDDSKDFMIEFIKRYLFPYQLISVINFK